MNYYPYFNSIPYMTSSIARPSLFKSLLGNINLSSILNGTQKTLNIVNQTIPLIKQAGPVLNNAKTMFRVMNEFKKVDTNIPNISSNSISSNSTSLNNISTINTQTYSNGPIFFQ